MSTRPIFIVGSPRSGTALLRDLLRSHPGITFPGESHFIPLFYRAYGDLGSEQQAIDLARRVLALRWVRRWELDLEPDSFRDCRSFRAVITRLYEQWAAKEGKARWGDKTPQYATELPLLHSIFPDGQILHIYRDGRDATLSILAAGFGPQNVYTAAAQWRAVVMKTRAAGHALPPGSYSEVCYEDLLTTPEATMRQVLSFLDEEFDPAVLKPSFLERDARPLLFGKAKPAAVSRTEIKAANRDKWKTRMKEDDQRLFESVAGDLLRELGYEARGDARPIRAGEEARWKIDNKLRWILRRLNTRQKSPGTAWLMLQAKLRAARRGRDS